VERVGIALQIGTPRQDPLHAAVRKGLKIEVEALGSFRSTDDAPLMGKAPQSLHLPLVVTSIPAIPRRF
jgi:hypothetical protein